MFSTTIDTVVFFRFVQHGCIDVFSAHEQNPSSSKGAARAGRQRGKVPYTSNAKWHSSHRSHTPHHIDSVHCTPYPAKINLGLDS